MRKSLVFIGVTWCVTFSQVPSFQPAELLKANGSPIAATTGNGSPQVVDWNGDGKKDLLLGQYGGGNIRLFLNSGTNSAPVLTTSSFLQADGKNIALTAG